jgi:hypothetical protein
LVFVVPFLSHSGRLDRFADFLAYLSC